MNKAKSHLSAPLAAAPPHSRAYSLLGGFYRSGWTMILMGVLLIVVAACGGGDSPAPKGDAAAEQATVQAEEPATEAPTADDQAAGQDSTSPFGGIEWCESNLGENREAVLVALYNATDGPNWTDNENWLTDAPLSEWAGVGSYAEWSEDRLVADCVLTLNLGRRRRSLYL